MNAEALARYHAWVAAGRPRMCESPYAGPSCSGPLSDMTADRERHPMGSLLCAHHSASWHRACHDVYGGEEE